MSPAKKPEPAPEKGKGTPAPDAERRIHCRRVDATYTVAEHKDCPYCFGKSTQVATGDHKQFCDFKPGEDPICFGFPEDFGRHTKE